MSMQWYSDWEREKEEREEEWLEKLQKEKERKEKLEKIKEENEAMLKSIEQYGLHVCENGQYSFFPPEVKTNKTKKREITKEEYENLAFKPYPYPIEDEDEDPFMQK